MNEATNLWARIRALTQLLNELRARVTSLEQRIAALEQSQAQRWSND